MESDALAQLLPLVSVRTGLVRTLSPIPRSALEPSNVFLYQAGLAHFDFRKADAQERGAAGKGERRDEAKLGALGEALERYCAYHADPSRLRVAAFDSIRGNAISPTDCVLFSEDQYRIPGFPYRRFDETGAISWIDGHDLKDGHEMLLPASLVYLNYTGTYGSEYFCTPTSNGLAAGPSIEFACANGLYELIERDAFLACWMNRLTPARIQGAPPFVESIRTQYARSGIELHNLLLPYDLPIHVVLSVAVNRTGSGPAAVIGLGCHLDPATALKRSVLEVCQGHAAAMVNTKLNPPQERLVSYESVQGLDDHCSFFTLPERLPELSFLLEGDRAAAFDAIPDFSSGNPSRDLQTCVQMLGKIGSRVAFAEITTPDLAGFPIHVVRVLATQLQPIHFGYAQERFGGRRIFELAKKLGLDQRERTEMDLNRCPHPLA